MSCDYKMSKMNCYYLLPYDLWHFLGTMSVIKRTLFVGWKNEDIALKKFSAVEAYVFENIIDRTRYNNEQCLEACRRLRNFASKLVEKWNTCKRNQYYFEVKNREWLDGSLLLID